MDRSLNKGFLMIELGVAIVLLSMFFFLISSWYSKAHQEYVVGLHKLKALNAATYFLEHTRAHPQQLKSLPRVIDDVSIIIRALPTELSHFIYIDLKAQSGDQSVKLKTGIII